MTIPAPSVSLRAITSANRAAVEALTVTAAQAEYVTGVAESLLEAAETPDACLWHRAVYADDAPVGFVMISDGIAVANPACLGPYFLWRLLIDQRYQRRGYGSAALRLAVEHVRTRPGAPSSLAAGSRQKRAAAPAAHLHRVRPGPRWCSTRHTDLPPLWRQDRGNCVTSGTHRE